MSDKGIIRVRGAREHNLKDIDFDVPKDKLVIITGPSGSGKSSLALDTLYSEGRRRYVESLSSYARQFLGVNKKPDVTKIEGLCPAIAIDQKTVGYNPRSTVGTITEIYDYMRVLFARAGKPSCPQCSIPITAESPETIGNMVLRKFDGKTVTIVAPIAIERKGEFYTEMEFFYQRGVNRFLIDGQMHRFSFEEQMYTLSISKNHRHNIYALMDNFTVSQDVRSRVHESVERAFTLTKGYCGVMESHEEGRDPEIEVYSSLRACFDCSMPFPELEPRLFSFNSPVGACPECHGLGVVSDWTQDEEDRWEKTHDECPSCMGKRLRPEACSVFIDKKNIVDVSLMSIAQAYEFFAGITLESDQEQIAGPLLYEIVNRLKFLIDVGLSYLSIGRQARTLSGGEGQRIRLATQIGSALAGVLYVLDEPSIGLHQRDNDRLIMMLKRLRDLGNTVLVVEHDMDTIKASDYVFDVGPGAGIHGGRITAHGTPEQIGRDENSLTGAYLSGRKEIAVPKKRRTSKTKITVKNATTNNLKNVTVDIPLGVFVGVSGVSGSGKSSLVMHTMAPVMQTFYRPGMSLHRDSFKLVVAGLDQLANCVLVNQAPIGRTPRSNPATYLGIFDYIRDLFAKTQESKIRGYKAGRFSFNVAEGRCQHCNGDGTITIEMHFLENVHITCKQCQGRRYNSQTLDIHFNGKNIHEVLCMPVHEALEFFQDFTPVAKRLKLLCDVGLDYLTLGQPSTTLSGGEAQRIKLVNELAKRGNNTFYILDEPTTGLHSDDVAKFLEVLNRLVEAGNSVLVIEHNLDVLKTVDHIIDLGPEGGDGGGTIVVQGTPEDVAACKESHTGRYLKEVL